LGSSPCVSLKIQDETRDQRLPFVKKMLHQPNLFSSEAPSGPADPEPKPLPKLQQAAPVWLRRLELFMRVAVRLYLGVFVLVLPWWPRFWDENPLFQLLPRLGELATYGSVRGIVSGFGLLNLWIAFHEAIHYCESDR
jgi:hypothetical protein